MSEDSKLDPYMGRFLKICLILSSGPLKFQMTISPPLFNIMNYPLNRGTSGAALFISELIYSFGNIQSGKFPSLSGAHAFSIGSQPGTKADRFTPFDTVKRCSYLLL